MPSRIDVLHLEDDPQDCELVRQLLLDSGIPCRIERAQSQEEFMTALQRRWDVILADYSLPSFDGRAALDIARKLAPQTPFVFVTGVMGEDVAIETLKQGATDYVLKQKIERIGPAVRRALEEREEKCRRERAQQALQKSEEQVRLLLQSTAEAIYGTDMEGNCTFCNLACVHMLGHGSGAELLGKNMHEVLHQRNCAGAVCEMQKGDGGRLSLHLEDATLWRKDGTSFPAEYWSHPILHDGSLRGAVVTFFDITERKRVGHELETRARELERSNAELAQFAYIASHDLQEPLRTIGSYVQLLAEQYEGKLDGEADQFIHFVVDAVSRMRTLIRDLLTYSRVGTRNAPFRPTAAGDVLQDVMRILQPGIEESGAEVTWESLPVVRGDGLQLGELFQNLIGNSIKYRGSLPPRIHIGVQRTPGEWIFSVRDNGIGIDPQYAETIFMIFRRLHTSEEYRGSGIGLAVCKKIVERHGGRIWVESRLGEGATFYFTLPAGEAYCARPAA